jgi:hypothetical protein
MPKALIFIALLMVLTGCLQARRNIRADMKELPHPDHLLRLWEPGDLGNPKLGLATEDGVLILSEPEYEVGHLFELQHPVGNSYVIDTGTIVRLNQNLAVVAPSTSRMGKGRFAAYAPRPDETIYFATRDERDKTVLHETALWQDGVWGDWIDVPRELDPEDTAGSCAGTGLYLQRAGRWEICGMISGLTATANDDDSIGLGFVGLAEIGLVLVEEHNFFDRDLLPHRPDFELGDTIEPEDIEPADDGR